ncbi:hypothetical protein SAMN05216328_1115 [Ensifer sp. YR511]|nr:hypothetical protein SAMN05216328_1115 [Ensifer sp. YR511]
MATSSRCLRSGARDVALKNGTENLFLGADITLANNISRITLQNVAGTQWQWLSSLAN